MKHMKLEVIDIVHPTPDSVSIHFAKPDPTFSYKPGQHGIFNFSIGGKTVSRTYSFSSSPDHDSHLAITVRSVNNGLVSNYLLHNKPYGVELQGVTGDFYIEPNSKSSRHLVMFAAGSGITPIMSMIRAVLLEEPLSTISLIYSNKSFERIIFRQELDELSSEHPGKLRIFHVLSTTNDAPEGYPIFYKDKLSKLVAKKTIKEILAENNGGIEYFMCGPYPFMQLLDETLQALNIDRTKVHREHFFIPSTSETEIDFRNLLTREVIVQQAEQERLLIVDGGSSILQAALANNVRLAHSCTEGQCGVCRAFLLSGKVKLKRNHILTDEELKSSQILLCQAFPVTDGVTIRPINPS